MSMPETPTPGASVSDLVGRGQEQAAMTGTSAASPADGYARGLAATAEAEGVLDRVEDELFRFARAVDANPQLRDRLTDPALEVGAKLDVLSGLLEGKAHPQTVAAAMFVVQSGRARMLTDIADALVRLAAERRAHSVAEVTSAVPLSDDQQHRLADAVARATGKQVDLKVVVDPKVVGGLVVRVGDTVIDGSVARRLSELRAALTGA
jgi:F-type H+-transporting ATPase subunit delta